MQLMMKGKHTIFFSWQSDNVKENKYIIKECLKKVSKSLNKDCSYEVIIDEGTNKTFGSPHISTTIFNKIDKCDIFVCDVSIINSNFEKNPNSRLTPNPNVMLELGYAVNLLGWERIICINNLQFGEIEKLPFDIRGNRISKYDSSKEGFELNLETTLKKAIKAILDNYETILDNHNSKENKSHDRNIATKFLAICSEKIFFESINGSSSNMRTTQRYYNLWQKYGNFYDDSLNRFTNSNLDSAVKIFIYNLDRFESKCSEIFFYHKDEQYSDTYIDRIYKFPKEPRSRESLSERNQRLNSVKTELVELGKEVKTSYQEVVLSIIKNGLI